MIIKSKHFKNYTTIDNRLLREPKISLKAKGLFCILASLPPDWNIVQSQLEQFSDDGSRATISAFKELIDYGIVKVTTKSDNYPTGFRGNVSYIVYPSLEYAERADAEQQETPNEQDATIIDTSLQNATMQNDSLLIKESTNKSKTNKSDDIKFGEGMRLYFDFFKSRNGFPPKINGTEGKSLKSILSYLYDCAGSHEQALNSFQYVLSNWDRLNDYLKKRMRLCDINSSIVNILVELKSNGNSKVTGKINTQYQDTLQKLLNEKRNG